MKKRKEFLLSNEMVDYIESYKDIKFLKNNTEALTQILSEHMTNSYGGMEKSAFELLIKELSRKTIEAFEETYQLKNTLTRIRLGTNNADRNSEVILLLLNTILAYSDSKALIEDDVVQTEEAKRIINDNIANFRAKAMERKKR